MAETNAPVDMRAEFLDGSTTNGQWSGVNEDGMILIQLPTGERAINRTDLRMVRFSHAKQRSSDNLAPTEAPASPTVAHTVTISLSDGGVLVAELADASTIANAIECRSLLGPSITIPFDKIAGVQLADRTAFERAHAIYVDALRQRPPGHDLLITRELQTVRRVEGQLDKLNAGGGSFSYGGQPRDFQLEKIYGVVFAATQPSEPPTLYPATVQLVDGSSVLARIDSATPSNIKLATSLGIEAELDLARVERIAWTSDRVVSLSDLNPSAQSVQGLVHRPWPVRKDRCTAGGPLVLGGKTYERGLGVHSRTELTFRLDGAYATFAATIGIDDTVRPGGSVVFFVRGDGQLLFDSGETTGHDPPRAIRVDVSSVKSLTLVVDYGRDLDIADQADWADARLIKPSVSPLSSEAPRRQQ